MKKASLISILIPVFLLLAGISLADTTATSENNNTNTTIAGGGGGGIGIGGSVVGPLIDMGRNNGSGNTSVGGVSTGQIPNSPQGSYTPYAGTAKDPNNVPSAYILNLEIPRVLGNEEFENFYANLPEKYQKLIRAELDGGKMAVKPVNFASPTEKHGGRISWFMAKEINGVTPNIAKKRGGLSVDSLSSDLKRQYAIVVAMDKARRVGKKLIIIFYYDSEKIVVSKNVEGGGWSAGIGGMFLPGASFLAPMLGGMSVSTDEELRQSVWTGVNAAVFEVIDEQAFRSLVAKNRSGRYGELTKKIANCPNPGMDNAKLRWERAEEAGRTGNFTGARDDAEIGLRDLQSLSGPEVDQLRSKLHATAAQAWQELGKLVKSNKGDYKPYFRQAQQYADKVNNK